MRWALAWSFYDDVIVPVSLCSRPNNSFALSLCDAIHCILFVFNLLCVHRIGEINCH